QPSAGNLNFTDSDFRLGAGSVAIDKGLDPNSDIFKGLFTTDSNLLAKVLNSLQSDKDGNQRIAGIAIDLGAYEYGSIPTTTTTTTTTSTTTTSTDAGTTTSTSTTTTTSSTTTTTIPCSNKSPEISGISPTKGTYADEITISGIDFCGEEGIVYFARLGTKKMADVESWNDDEIVVSVPWGLKQGIYKVKVATALGNESNQIPFKFLKPIPHITGLSI
ncbi:MAG TPA: choice-of-anchor Q domain-containing protein, partial [Thermodesulfovibrionia bacterium]|nr:choice-of-anchor Q domain-containing protein [Thermodesulfovibrionia bacterium]